MNIKQKVIHKAITSVEHLAESMNKEGQEGWKLTNISTVINKKGGAIFTKKSGYYFDDYLFIFNHSEKLYNYRCIYITRRNTNIKQEEELINSEVEKLNNEGFELIHILTPASISDLPDYPTCGARGYVLIFIKEVIL